MFCLVNKCTWKSLTLIHATNVFSAYQNTFRKSPCQCFITSSIFQLLCYRDNIATNSSNFDHCFDASRWSVATFCFDFTLMITLRLGSSMTLLLQCRRANYKKLPYNQVDSFFGHKTNVCDIDIPKDEIVCKCDISSISAHCP